MKWIRLQAFRRRWIIYFRTAFSQNYLPSYSKECAVAQPKPSCRRAVISAQMGGKGSEIISIISWLCYCSRNEQPVFCFIAIRTKPIGSGIISIISWLCYCSRNEQPMFCFIAIPTHQRYLLQRDFPNQSS